MSASTQREISFPGRAVSNSHHLKPCPTLARATTTICKAGHKHLRLTLTSRQPQPACTGKPYCPVSKHQQMLMCTGPSKRHHKHQQNPDALGRQPGKAPAAQQDAHRRTSVLTRGLKIPTPTMSTGALHRRAPSRTTPCLNVRISSANTAPSRSKGVGDGQADQLPSHPANKRHPPLRTLQS